VNVALSATQRHGVVFLLAASIASSIGGLPFNTLPLLIGGFADSLQLGAAALGVLGSACTGGYLVSTLFGPLWVERANWQIATIVASIFCAAALALSGHSNGTPYMSMAVFGFAAGLMHSLGMRMVGEMANKERVFGVRLLTELVLVSLLLMLFPIVVARHGLPGGLTLLAGAVLMMALSAGALPRGPVLRQDAHVAASRVDRARMASGLYALGIFVLFACGQVALWLFIERIGRERGTTAEQLGLLFSVLKIVGGASAAFVALLGSRMGQRLPHWLVLGGIVVGVALLAQRDSFAVFAGGAWLWEAAFTIGCVYQTAAIARLDASRRLIVLIPAAFAVSAFVGPALGGYLVERIGFAALFAVAVMCAIVPAIAYTRFARTGSQVAE